jgi:hypothetical protein
MKDFLGVVSLGTLIVLGLLGLLLYYVGELSYHKLIWLATTASVALVVYFLTGSRCETATGSVAGDLAVGALIIKKTIDGSKK